MKFQLCKMLACGVLVLASKVVGGDANNGQKSRAIYRHFLAGKKVSMPETESFGCRIFYRE